ncbi:MAG: DsrE family protein [Nitrospinae bacterium]|nr:DsrE family protein [Nitrospinota bacterium]
MKNVTVVINSAPGFPVGEKLRMAVGLTLEDGNAVSVLFIDDGVYAALGLDREKTGVDIQKHVKMLGMMNKTLCAHGPSLETRGVDLTGSEVKKVTGAETEKMLAEADVIF